MKKIFSKIFIVTLVLGFFFAPVQENLSSNKEEISILTTNTAFAQQAPGYVYTYTNVLTGPNTQSTIFTTIEECRAARTATLNRFGTLQSVIDSMSPDCIPTTQTDVQQGIEQLTGINTEPNEYGCGAHPKTWFTNCLVQAVYLIIFQPVAFFARLAAYVLDFFVFYSVSSGSYVSDFIESGWGIVRDIANVIFIVALLYVAVKTVLGLNSSNNKKMVGMIIVMALLINFSLFATKVVIDASNILARVFYSNIDSVDQNGVTIEGTDTGQKSITVGLVKQFNPHAIFGSAVTIEQNLGAFTAILIMSLLMMGYMIFMFLSVALLFVARVIMLWILMIFSPIAFVSLTIPSMKIPGFGWDEWWKQLSENAFLAPIFVFFLYLIISFGDVIKVVTGNTLNTNNSVNGLEISGAVPETTFQQYMAIVIPFILIFMLLSKAKEIAVKMSGEMGSAVKTGTAMLGGVAFGGAAFLGTQTLGRAGLSLANSKIAEKWRNIGTRIEKDENGNDVVVANKGLAAYGARLGLKTFKSAGEGSFNVKNTVLGEGISKLASGGNLKSVISGLGDTKGGYKASVDKKAKEIEEEKDLYKTSMSDDETKTYTLKKRAEYLNKLERKVAEAREKASVTEKDAAEAEVRKQYVILNGQAPKIHEKADSLNKERMLAFKDRIGKSDLLSSMAYDTSKAFGYEVNQNNYLKGDNGRAYKEALRKKKKQKAKEEATEKGEVWTKEKDIKWEKDNANMDTSKYDALLAREINDSRAKTVKMYVGAAVGVGAGMVGGALAGTYGSMIVNAGVGAAVAKTSSLEKSIQDKAIESMDKEAKNTEKLANRIADLNKTLKDGKGIQRTNILDENGNQILNSAGEHITSGLFIQSAPGVDTDQVDKDKLRLALASMDTEIRLLDKKPTLTDDEKEQLNDLKVQREKMQALKTAEKELFDLTGKKPGGGSSASNPPPATT